MVSRRAIAAISVLLGLLAPSAHAHLVPFAPSKVVRLGPYAALMDAQPSPLFVNDTLGVTAIFSRVDDGSYVGRGIRPQLDVSDPFGTNISRPMVLDASGTFFAAVPIRSVGNYSIGLSLADRNATFSNRSSVRVYPDLGIRLAADDPSQSDPLEGQPFNITIKVTDRAGRPDRGLLDVTLLMEHRTDPEGALLDTTTRAMNASTPGRWRVTFDGLSQGSYDVRFASDSGDFGPDDVPAFHFSVKKPEDPLGTPQVADGPMHRLPMVSVAEVAALALVALAFARRRDRRS